MVVLLVYSISVSQSLSVEQKIAACERKAWHAVFGDGRRHGRRKKELW